jgi:hypothetical protein
MHELTALRTKVGPVLAALIAAGVGDRAAPRFLEFCTVNIRNRKTRAAYGPAAVAFPRWCEGQGWGAFTLRPCRGRRRDHRRGLLPAEKALHEKNGKLN